MTTNNAQSEAKRENTLIENVKVLALYKKDLRNYLMWKGDSGLVATIEKMEKQAALLDAPETVEGLENLEEALERESKFQGLMFCDHGKIDRSDKGIGQAFAIYQAARLYAQSRQSAGVPDGWKLVPVEPTSEMISAAHKDQGANHYDEVFTEIYIAMIKAAPPQDKPALPENVTIVEKSTCYAVHVDGLCVANFAGPDSEEHAGIFARALSPPPPPSAVDVEAIKCEIWQAIAEKHQNAQGDIRAATVIEVIDHLHQRGLIGQDLAAVREKIEGLKQTANPIANATFWDGHNQAIDAVLALLKQGG